jgi:starvation-inducible DNA-binding protein
VARVRKQKRKAIMKGMNMTDRLTEYRLAPLKTRTELDAEAATEVSMALVAILADAFALYVKTKSFHWHVSGPHFRDYHRLFDEQAGQVLEMVDPLAERARKLGRHALRSIGQVASHQTILDNDADHIDPQGMLAELRDDNGTLVARMRSLHDLCDQHGDIATASLLETLVDEAEGRRWVLFEASRAHN